MTDITADEFGLVEKAKALEPLLRTEAPKGEAGGRLTDATMDALWAAGLMGL
ncbi:MAG: hypothetical protein HOI98_19745, partial [Rhodospirillaceae bacterium]|nr:hypothetical protein [Rhodospirillaceae bacterium]